MNQEWRDSGTTGRGLSWFSRIQRKSVNLERAMKLWRWRTQWYVKVGEMCHLQWCILDTSYKISNNAIMKCCHSVWWSFGEYKKISKVLDVMFLRGREEHWVLPVIQSHLQPGLIHSWSRHFSIWIHPLNNPALILPWNSPNYLVH